MTTPFAVVRAADIDVPAEDRRWLVRDLWGRSAVGIVGGAPKCCKSWFALDMAVSVASGTPCLGRFDVDQVGNTLVFLAEDALVDVKSRLAAIAASRGLDFAALAVDAISEPVVRLDLAAHRERLVLTLEQRRPRLLLLDPLVRLHRLDENSAQEISGVLGFLRELQRSYDCAVVLVHHSSKKHRSRPGQALRGSSDLHAFGDSNAYLSSEGDHEFVLTIEHRQAAAPPQVRLRLTSQLDGSATHLAVASAVVEAPAVDLAGQVVDHLRHARGPVLRRDLRQSLRISNNRLGDVLVDLERSGRIRREAEGWVVPPPPEGQASLF